MSWRTVVITKTCKLDYSMGYLVVRDVEKTTKIHISEISMLIVESTSVAVTVALLNELTKKSVKVIFCDEKHSPSFEVTPYYDSCKSSLKLKQQIDWDDHIKQYIWTNIVAEKISNQAKVLKQFQLPQYTQLYNILMKLSLMILPIEKVIPQKCILMLCLERVFQEKMIVPLMLCLIMVIVSYFLLLTGKLCQMVT